MTGPVNLHPLGIRPATNQKPPVILWSFANVPWIELHTELRDHPKVARLLEARDLNLVDCDHAIGKLSRLWLWTLSYAPTGILTRFSPAQLAIAIGVDQAVGPRWLEVLTEAGWLDPDPLRIHDWWEYAGPYLRKRYDRRPEIWRDIQAHYEPTTAPLESSDPHTNGDSASPSRVRNGSATGPPRNYCGTVAEPQRHRSGVYQPTNQKAITNTPKETAPGECADNSRCVCVLVDFYDAWLLQGFDNDGYVPSAADQKAAADVVAKLGARDHRPALKRVVALMRQKFPAAKKFGASLPYWDEVLATLAKTEAVKQARQRTTEQTTQTSARAQAAATADSELIARYTAPFTNLDESEQRRRVDEFAGSGVVPAAFSRRLAILKFAKEVESDGER